MCPIFVATNSNIKYRTSIFPEFPANILIGFEQFSQSLGTASLGAEISGVVNTL